MESAASDGSKVFDRLNLLYPAVDEKETPLPRSWSSKDKYNYIGLSQNNLRVHYKGHGKTHKDAASVRATHPIPPSCGIYYFEVRIVSKGRDGYMGIGLSGVGVNMNRLPGWDKHSYGYHGDDGHSFCSSGTGQPYGPTFTTGDVIGCGVNLIDSTVFYTKNGHNLGLAFSDVPPNLYPTVGLQTPGEVVDANFGQSPFVFDMEDMMREARAKVHATILDYNIPNKFGSWQDMLKRMVSAYVAHHGYCATAEAFGRGIGQPIAEEIASMRNRQKILNLVSQGRMGEAVETTSKLYPGLLEGNKNLLFTLKCRQFIEMVNGTDSEVCDKSQLKNGAKERTMSPTASPNSSGSSTPNQIPPLTHVSELPTKQPANARSVIQSTKSVNNSVRGKLRNNIISAAATHVVAVNGDMGGTAAAADKNGIYHSGGSESMDDGDVDVDMRPASPSDAAVMVQQRPSVINDGRRHLTPNMPNGDISSNENGDKLENMRDEQMEVEYAHDPRLVCGGSRPAIEKMIEFGKELFQLSRQLKKEQGPNEANKQMLRRAFSLLAYMDPWKSPVGWQLEPSEREAVCSALNSAILESSQLARRPPLEIAVAHAEELVSLMSRSGIGACAFANVESFLRQN